MEQPYAWDAWAQSDDVHEFRAHITACYSSVVSTPEASPPPLRRRRRGLFGALFDCCRRRPAFDAVPEQEQLVLFVAEEDMRTMAGSGIRSDEEAAACFASWYRNVSPSRRMGTPSRPSVIVEVDGVAVPQHE